MPLSSEYTAKKPPKIKNCAICSFDCHLVLFTDANAKPTKDTQAWDLQLLNTCSHIVVAQIEMTPNQLNEENSPKRSD